MSVITTPYRGGRRLSYETDFSINYGNLDGNDGWVRVAGTGIIMNLTSDATLGGLGAQSCTYLQTGNGYNRNRRVVCDITSDRDNSDPALFLTSDSSVSYYFKITVSYTAFGDDLGYQVAYGGIPIGGVIQTMTSAGTARTITILRSGKNIVVTCSPGLSGQWTYTLAGSIDNTDNDRPGIGWTGTSVGPGTHATWDNFEARVCNFTYEEAGL